MIFKVAFLCLATLAVCNGQFLANIFGLRPLRPLTLTIATRRQTTTWTPSCWVTDGPAPTETCSDVRRRRAIEEESQDPMIAEESADYLREARQIDQPYGFYYADGPIQSSLSFRNAPYYPDPYYADFRQRPARPTLIAFVTRSLVPHSVVASTTKTVTVNCLYPSLITKCPGSVAPVETTAPAETPAPVETPAPELIAPESAPESATDTPSA